MPRLSAFPKCYLEAIARERTMTVFEWIEESRQLDCDGLEMYEAFFESLDTAYLDRVRAAITATGRAMPMLCCSPDFTNPDRAARTAAIEHQVRMIETAHRLGGPGVVCRVLSGQRYPEVSRDEGLTWAAECINACLPTARRLGVVLGLENHYKDGHWKYAEFAQRMDVFLELLERIPERTHFGVQYDPSNAVVAGDDPVELLRRVAPRVVSMHASDRYLVDDSGSHAERGNEEGVGYPDRLKHGVTGEGLNDYDAIFRILAEHQYSGWISIEDGLNGMDEMARSLAFLRRKGAEHFGLRNE